MILLHYLLTNQISTFRLIGIKIKGFNLKSVIYLNVPFSIVSAEVIVGWHKKHNGQIQKASTLCLEYIKTNYVLLERRSKINNRKLAKIIFSFKFSWKPGLYKLRENSAFLNKVSTLLIILTEVWLN